MELLVVLTIVGIVAGLGIPSFARLVHQGDLSSRAASIVSDLKTARSVAITRGQPVIVCPVDVGTATPECDGTNWADGWLVGMDPDGDNRINSDSDIVRLESGEAALSGMKDDPARIRFSADGMSAHDGTQSVGLKPSECGADEARAIEVSSTGRVRSKKVDC